MPREIRDMIASHLIQRRTAPPCPPFGSSTPASGTWRLGDVAQFTHPRLQRLPCLAQVNYKLHDEVVDLARHSYRAGKLIPEVDIMVKGSSIYSAWTVVPITIERGILFNFNVKLHVFGTEVFHGSNDRLPLHGKDFRALLKLLNNLLESGPSLEDMKSTAYRLPFRIDTLDVHVTSGGPHIRNSWPQTLRPVLRNLKGLAASGIAHPCSKHIGTETKIQTDGEHTWIKKKWQVSASACDEGLQEFRHNEFQLLPNIQGQDDLLKIARLTLGNRDSAVEAVTAD